MKKHCWICVLALALCLAIPCAGLADLRRGSKGEDVKALQQALIDLGFLNDKADGIFGKKTEQAVKEWQWYLGEEDNGVMTDEDLAALDNVWSVVMDVATEANLPEEELRDLFPAFCTVTEDELGQLRTVSCYRHYRQQDAIQALTAGQPPEKIEKRLAQRIRDLWLDDIRQMYADWALTDEAIAREQESIFEQAYAERQAEWKSLAKRAGDTEALTEETLWLDAIGAGLCFDLYGAEGE